MFDCCLFSGYTFLKNGVLDEEFHKKLIAHYKSMNPPPQQLEEAIACRCGCHDSEIAMMH